MALIRQRLGIKIFITLITIWIVLCWIILPIWSTPIESDKPQIQIYKSHHITSNISTNNEIIEEIKQTKPQIDHNHTNDNKFDNNNNQTQLFEKINPKNKSKTLITPFAKINNKSKYNLKHNNINYNNHTKWNDWYFNFTAISQQLIFERQVATIPVSITVEYKKDISDIISWNPSHKNNIAYNGYCGSTHFNQTFKYSTRFKNYNLWNNKKKK
eukprot:423931_1